jgi:hypothetical protein
MAHEAPDSRTPKERLADIVDSKLFDLYHKAGLIEASHDSTLSHNQVLVLLRAAYWRGVTDFDRDQSEMRRIAADHVADLERVRDTHDTR